MIDVLVRSLGVIDYSTCYRAMREFTLNRDAHSVNEVWVCEHEPVYTQGMNGKKEHLLDLHDIPLINSDRGGQVTYHGPGQLVIYPLLSLDDTGCRVKQYVHCLEQSVLNCLSHELGLNGHRREGAPGVYIDNKKIAALGIRIKRGCTYHGIAINVNLDLQAYDGIHTCGYSDMEVTSLLEQGASVNCSELADKYLPFLANELGLSLLWESDESIKTALESA